MSDPAASTIPRAVEDFLANHVATAVDGATRLNAKRFLNAPCSRQAFCSVSKRLEKAAGCSYDHDHQLRFVADIALIAAEVPYQAMRNAIDDLPLLFKAAAAAARDLSDAIE